MANTTKAQPNGSRPAQAAQQQLKPARRKGKPWHPLSGQLGVPTQERAAQSHGFEEVNLAAGDGPKVVRSAEKMPFTPRHVRDRYTEEEIARALRMKQAPNFEKKLTAIDRALEENEFLALDWLVSTRLRREIGRPTALRYDDTPRGVWEDGGGDDREKRWRIDQNILAVVDELLPEAYLQFLDCLIWQMHPGYREGLPPSKLEIGQEISQMRGRDAATGAFVGYTRAVAQAISNARANAAIIIRRRREAREQLIREERKAEAALHFRF